MKTYCISDIHGHIDNLNRFIETLDKDDDVYVLGDVIDKGPESIECLLKVMNDKRFNMLLGNHEYMMFNLLSSKSNSYQYSQYYEEWITWNNGEETLNSYNALSTYKKKKVFDYIKSLPLIIPSIKVNDKTFYLAHSKPVGNKYLTMEDLDYDADRIAEYIWDRYLGIEDLCDGIAIVGHTFVQMYQDKCEPFFNSKNIKDATYIDIDGGLAMSSKDSHLIALCLDDLSYKLY